MCQHKETEKEGRNKKGILWLWVKQVYKGGGAGDLFWRHLDLCILAFASGVGDRRDKLEHSRCRYPECLERAAHCCKDASFVSRDPVIIPEPVITLNSSEIKGAKNKKPNKQ